VKAHVRQEWLNEDPRLVVPGTSTYRYSLSPQEISEATVLDYNEATNIVTLFINMGGVKVAVDVSTDYLTIEHDYD